jgi:hypothetical protein
LGLLRSLSTVFAVGMIGGAGVLMMLPLAGDERPVAARARIPDPPALPCKKQSWPSADRACLTWTAARKPAKAEAERAAVARLRVAEPKQPAAPDELRIVQPEANPPPQTVARAEPLPALRMHIAPGDGSQRAVATWPPLDETLQPNHPSPAATSDIAFAPVTEPAQNFVPPAAPPRVTARVSQSATPRRARIAAAVTTVDGRRRMIPIRPHSQQDVYYYAMRR